MKINRKGALAAPTPRFHVGPIASHIDSFAKFLTDQGYAPLSVESKCLLVADLSRWLKRRGLPLARVDEGKLKQFHAHHRRSIRRGDLAASQQLLKWLRDIGVVPALPQTVDQTVLGRLTQDYGRFLSSQRGLAPATLSSYLPIVRRFLTERFGNKALLSSANIGFTDRYGFDRHQCALWHDCSMLMVSGILIQLIGETLRWWRLAFRSRQSIETENLFLRRQLALYVERGINPRRIDPATRISLAFLSRFFNWRNALVVVRPETMIRWHRAGWKLFWRLKSRPGRPPIPQQLQALIRRMGSENPAWGEERIANELLLKLGIQVSPRTVRKYLPPRPPGRPRGDMRWSTFLRLHAQGIIACDFLVVVTATFRLLYVFVVIEHRSRRLVHCNVTAHPTAGWTLQQLREAVGFEERYQYLLHDRDSIFAAHLDESVRRLGIAVVKSPPRCPKANAICERVIGTVRRECLDWLIPLSESHLRSILRMWTTHYNIGRPHMALGPGVPDPPPARFDFGKPRSRHRSAESYAVHAKSILGGLHHEYSLAPTCA